MLLDTPYIECLGIMSINIYIYITVYCSVLFRVFGLSFLFWRHPNPAQTCHPNPHSCGLFGP